MRPLWIERIRRIWEKVPIAWLAGVRRVGKTTLAQSLPNIRYVNCDLPGTAEAVKDIEGFYKAIDRPAVVFDEIHQLPDPSRVLKIGADVFPHLRILATGSSTLAASDKFRDTLTGRKRAIRLLPVLADECDLFGVPDMRRRLLHGGLPEQLMSPQKDPDFFLEWIDSFYARDIQELFRVGKRTGFLKLFELVMRRSGGLLETTNLARHCELSRPTVMSYLDMLQIACVATVVRPYHAAGRQEILRQPKLYGFDTGFVSFCSGWNEIHATEMGLLWEHVVLETLMTLRDPSRIFFWRDKQQREIDFVLPVSDRVCDAIECKWDPDTFSLRGIKAFRALYPEGRNAVISPQIHNPYVRTTDGVEVVYCNLTSWQQGFGRTT